MQDKRDEQVIKLLGRLKDAGPEYPRSLQQGRRAAVLASLAVLPVAGGLVGTSLLAQIAKLIKAMSVIDKIILGVELVAVSGLTTYGAVNAYIYRDTIKQLLFPSAIQSPFPTLSIPPTGTPIPPTAAPGTGTPTPTGTLIATLPPFFTPQAGSTSQPQGTPVLGQPTNPPPATNPPRATRTNPGNHYGQTPTKPSKKP